MPRNGETWTARHPRHLRLVGDAPFCIHLPDSAFEILQDGWEMLFDHIKVAREGPLPYIGGTGTNLELLRDRRGIARFSRLAILVDQSQATAALGPENPYGSALLQEVWLHFPKDQRIRHRNDCPGDPNAALRMLRDDIANGEPAQRAWLSTLWRQDILGTVWRRAANRIASVTRALCGEYHLGSVDFFFPGWFEIQEPGVRGVISIPLGSGIGMAQPDVPQSAVARVASALEGSTELPVHQELIASAKHRLESDEPRLALLDSFSACDVFLRELIDVALVRRYSEAEIKVMAHSDKFDFYRNDLFNLVFAEPLANWRPLPKFVEKVQQKRNKVTHVAEGVTYSEAFEAVGLAEGFIVHVESLTPII